MAPVSPRSSAVSATAVSAATVSASAELDGCVAAQLAELMPSVHEADGPRLGAGDQGLRAGASGVVVHALQHLPVGDAGDGEEAVVAGHEIVGVEHPVEVVTGVDGGLALIVVARPQASLDLAAHAFHRCCRDHAFGRTSDAEQD